VRLVVDSQPIDAILAITPYESRHFRNRILVLGYHVLLSFAPASVRIRASAIPRELADGELCDFAVRNAGYACLGELVLKHDGVAVAAFPQCDYTDGIGAVAVISAEATARAVPGSSTLQVLGFRVAGVLSVAGSDGVVLARCARRRVSEFRRSSRGRC
jgi:hypothetical protein